MWKSIYIADENIFEYSYKNTKLKPGDFLIFTIHGYLIWHILIILLLGIESIGHFNPLQPTSIILAEPAYLTGLTIAGVIGIPICIPTDKIRLMASVRSGLFFSCTEISVPANASVSGARGDETRRRRISLL